MLYCRPQYRLGDVVNDELYVITYDDDDIRYVQPYKLWILIHGEEPFEWVKYGHEIDDTDRQLVRIPISV